MPVPAADLVKTHLDAATDDPSQARAQLLAAVDKINSLLTFLAEIDELLFEDGAYNDLPIRIGASNIGLYSTQNYFGDPALIVVVDGVDIAAFVEDGGAKKMLIDEIIPFVAINFATTTSHNQQLISLGQENSSYTANLIQSTVARSSSTAFNFFEFWCTGGDRKAKLDGTGQLHLDNGTVATPGDYAEAFEWHDGNPNGEDRRGMTVSIQNGKIKIAANNETVIGVVSARPVICGDAAPNGWQGKYQLDDYGAPVVGSDGGWVYSADYNEYIEDQKTLLGNDTSVIEKALELAKERWLVERKNVDGIDSAAKEEKEFRKYYGSIKEQLENRVIARMVADDYEPRLSRREWDAVGLVGKLWVRQGQEVDKRWLELETKPNGLKRYLVR